MRLVTAMAIGAFLSKVTVPMSNLQDSYLLFSLKDTRKSSLPGYTTAVR